MIPSTLCHSEGTMGATATGRPRPASRVSVAQGPRVRREPTGPLAVTARGSKAAAAPSSRPPLLHVDRDVDEEDQPRELRPLEDPEGDPATGKPDGRWPPHSVPGAAPPRIPCPSTCRLRRLRRPDPGSALDVDLPETRCTAGSPRAAASPGPPPGRTSSPRRRDPSSQAFLNSFSAEPSEHANFGIRSYRNRTSTTTNQDDHVVYAEDPLQRSSKCTICLLLWAAPDAG